MWVAAPQVFLDWKVDQFGAWKCRHLDLDSTSKRGEQETVRLLHLQDPVQTGPLDCQFTLACDTLVPDKSNYLFDAWYSLQPPVTLTDVATNAIFMLEEVRRYDEKFREEWSVAPAVNVEKPLSTTERNTLLAIIAVLCREAKLDYKTASKTSDLIESTAAEMGISIGATSIRDHLKKIPDALRTRMK